MLQSFSRGYYTPSFYKIRVNTSYDLTDLNKLSRYPEPFSTFFHEYLHYIQDISTSFGIMNALMNLNRLKFSNHSIINGPKEFEIPISFTYDSNFKLQEEMQAIYIGDIILSDINQINSVKIVDSSTYIPEPHNTYLEKIRVEYINSHNENCEIDFGGISIVESMAHIAQTKFYPNTQHNDIPYKFALKIAEFLYPEFVVNDLYVFALCDASLMSFHPGKTFVDILIGFKKDKIIPKSEEEVYSLVYQTITAKDKTLNEHYIEMITRAQIELTHYFTTHLHEAERKWIKTILERVSNIRTNSPEFLLKILKEEKVNSNLFNNLVLEIGSPLIENLVNENHIFLPRGFDNINIDIFSGIREVYSLFERAKVQCGLVDFCKSSKIGNITDNRCKTSPWSRVNDKNLCSYAMLWKMWGLSDFKPIIK